MKKLLSVKAFCNMIKTGKTIREIYFNSPLSTQSDRLQLQFTAAVMASPIWQEVLELASKPSAAYSVIALRSYCESRAGDVPAQMKAQAAKCFEVSK